MASNPNTNPDPNPTPDVENEDLITVDDKPLSLSHSVDLEILNFSFRVESAAFFKSPRGVVFNSPKGEEKERTRIADTIEAGFSFLSDDSNFDPANQTLLALKIILEAAHEQVQENFSYIAMATPSLECPTIFELNVEDIELLMDYEEFWIHSCSIVFHEMNDMRNRILSSDLHHIGKANDNQSLSNYTEVILFVHANSEVDDKGIHDREDLKEFLYELTGKNIQKVHVTCSSFIMKEEELSYSHLVI